MQSIESDINFDENDKMRKKKVHLHTSCTARDVVITTLV